MSVNKVLGSVQNIFTCTSNSTLGNAFVYLCMVYHTKALPYNVLFDIYVERFWTLRSVPSENRKSGPNLFHAMFRYSAHFKYKTVPSRRIAIDHHDIHDSELWLSNVATSAYSRSIAIPVIINVHTSTTRRKAQGKGTLCTDTTSLLALLAKAVAHTYRTE